MNTVLIAGVAAAVLAGTTAQATVVLTDNFNSDPHMLDWTGDAVFASLPGPASQGPRSASTDLIGPGFFNLDPGNGNYVDLDGSTGYGNLPYAGVLQSKASFGPGKYTLSFELGGNARSGRPQTTEVFLGSTLIATLTLNSSTPLTLHTYFFNSPTGGNLTFDELGPSDFRGNILDNVTLATGVPEPAGWALMLVGLAVAGSTLRRSRPTPAAS